MSQVSVVTGANGHLGNNLVRVLLEQGDTVVAGTRGLNPDPALAGLACATAWVDLHAPDSLERAFRGAARVYLVGGVFKHWARNPQAEIYEANIAATRNALAAAAQCKVPKIVYISSLAATNRDAVPITEAGWNADTANIYFRSKTDSERLAWELAQRAGIDMVSVLPGAMVGAHCYRLTPTMELLQTVLDGRLKDEPGFWFNFVDVRDVALACRAAAERGRNGERYLLANENCTSVKELARIARKLFPNRNIPVPRTAPRALAWLIAAVAELRAAIDKSPPSLQRNFLRAFSVQEICNVEKARTELDFKPAAPAVAIEHALRYLAARGPGYR